MMIALLSGMMVIKMQVTRSKNKGRTPARCLASRSCDGLVYVRRREERLEVTDTCFKIILYENHRPKVYFDSPSGCINI